MSLNTVQALPSAAGCPHIKTSIATNPSHVVWHTGSEGKVLAKDIAQRFLRTMHATWCSDTPFRHKMVEKWDASAIGGTGGGGEYRVQTGTSNVLGVCSVASIEHDSTLPLFSRRFWVEQWGDAVPARSLRLDGE